MYPRLFIINVGVNASHGNLKSPIFEDGSFIFIPIPERKINQNLELPRYRDILPEALPYIPKSYHDVKIHNDPEFTTFTYGDYPTKHPRAALLKLIKPRDFLFFLARLVCWSTSENNFTNKAGFYIIGYFHIDYVISEVTIELANEVLISASNNAHVKRGKCNKDKFDKFWIVKGSHQSSLLPRALPFDRHFASHVMVDRQNQPWTWDQNRTDLQIIGSYTRSCRMITDRKKVKFFLEKIEKYSTKLI